MAKIHGQLERAQLENLTTAQEPAQGITGRTWLNTDTGLVRVDDGTVIKDVGTAAVPTGAVMDWSASTAPTGWLLCDGSTILRASFPALNSLFSADSYPYGNGDGGTTFELPDLRGRTVVGKDDMGGVSANRVTVAESGIDGDVLGDVGGAETHALAEAELASHTHTANVTDTGHNHASPTADFLVNSTSAGNYALGAAGLATVVSTTASATTGITVANVATGSGDTHQNMQPTLILNKIIKT